MFYKDIADEERVHAGEFLRLLKELAPDEQKFYDEGAEEVEEEIKKKLPLIPHNIAVITSPTGAAIRDVITISLRRFPNLSILVVPSLVQGASAAREIAKKIDFLNRFLKS